MADRPGESRLRNAKDERRWMIQQLKRCVCAWPLQVMRNGSGHADGCPAHIAWKESRA